MDTTKQPKSVISFCSGYAGIERGLDLAGVEHRVLAYVEIEGFAIANLVAKMETGQLVPAPIWSNLKTFPAHLFRDCVDIITGGYPCQPFSAAGKRLGTEDPRHLWPFIRRHIESIRPVQCFFENVEGHISLGLREVIGDLEGAGYRATWGIFSAAEVGAPHQRKRVYILADAKSQRYGARRKKRDIYQENGRQNWECLPEPAIASTRPGGEVVSAGEKLADPISARLQGYAECHRNDEARQPNKITNGHFAQKDANGGGQAVWPPEPRLGRVVDGCPDRVDRIRLLGNGVVPQTAAKAWITLNDRIIKNEH